MEIGKFEKSIAFFIILNRLPKVMPVSYFYTLSYILHVK